MHWRGIVVVSRRQQSTLNSYFEATGKTGLIIKSSSTNVFENLALEDWIHDRIDLQKRRVLLFWRNAAAVVIGRHQNLWQECSVAELRRLGVPVARRRSGGGSVYHDLGNLNMTFFTSKKNYDRTKNLEIVTSALRELRPNLDVRATERFDILLNGSYKISGTAAKLGRNSAYHHCTLLCSADRSVLSSVLKSTCSGIKSNATPSVPSPVSNLCEQDPTLDLSLIMDAITSRHNTEFNLNCPIITVDPGAELQLPGIHKMKTELQNWDWVYGKTPKFSICTSIEVQDRSIDIEIHIKNGVIENFHITPHSQWLPPEVVKEICDSLTGIRFCPNEFAVVLAAFTRTASLAHEQNQQILNLYQSILSIM